MSEEYTRYERARMIGARALQIARGAPLMVKTEIQDPIKIAEMEFDQKLIPLDVRKKAAPRTDRHVRAARCGR